MSEGQVRAGSGAMFDAIATRYDFVNRVISLGGDQAWRRQAARALELPDGPTTVVDLATGTGDVALAIVARYPRASVIGIDPSAGMLSIAEKKLAKRGLGHRIELRRGEAEAIPLDDASVAGVTVAFGIRNVADRPRALREMRRVTQPGGRVVVLEATDPNRGAMKYLARLHIHTVVPTLGALLSRRKEYAYFESSVAAFPSPERFAEMLADAGLDLVSTLPLAFGAAHLFVCERPADPGP